MERIIVDSDRDVIVPSELKEAIVQHDHNIMDIIIECPRYWYEGKKDISDCVFFINVLTEKTIKGKEPIAIPCTNKHVKEDDEYTMEMTWTITRDVSKHEGGFAFLVCAKKTDEEGNEDLHWNSHLCKEMVVSEGLEANLQEIESEYPDIITYILQELEDIRKNGTGGTTDAVQYVEQTLTEEQKTQARINIGAAAVIIDRDTKTMNISSGGVTDNETISELTDYVIETIIFDGVELKVSTDDTLTESGKAADAKAVGEEIEKLSEAVVNQGTQISVLGGLPDYVQTEAARVAENILSVRNAKSFVFGAVSDLHTTGSDVSTTSILHAGMGMDAIQSITQLDLLAIFGDVMVGYLDDSYKSGFTHVKKCFSSVVKAVPFIQMQGNHDQLSSDTAEEAQQKYFAYIGANNINTVTDWENRFRNYGYKDFEDQKMRVIYLNSADVSEEEVTSDAYVTAQQLFWFANTALDFSGKTDEDNWSFVVFCHHPLNWYGNISNILNLLDAYIGKSNGSIVLDETTINYDFTNAGAEFIAHFHGHLHNFRVETLGTNGVLSITIPNACFGRNNEYGTYSGYDEEVRTNYGDTDESGNQRQFNKTSGTAEDTSFNILVLNRINRTIHAFCYGAGIDRVITFDGEVTEIEKDTETEEPDNSNDDYTNLIDTVGYANGYRLSTSTGELKEQSGYVTTGLIDLSAYELNTPVTIRTKGVNFSYDEYAYCAIVFYGEDGSVYSTNFTNNINSRVGYDENGDCIFAVSHTSDVSGFKICGYGDGDDLIVTINEEIPDDTTTGNEDEANYTNLVPTAIDTDGTVFNETGYIEGYRLNSSGTTTALEGAVSSGYIPYNGEIIRAYGSTNSASGATGNTVQLFDSSFLFIQTFTVGNGFEYEELNGKYLMTIEPSVAEVFSTASYVRVSFATCTGSDFVVTLDEKIS